MGVSFADLDYLGDGGCTERHADTPRSPDGPLRDDIVVSVRGQEGDAPLVEIVTVGETQFLQETLLEGGGISEELAVGEALCLGGIDHGDLVRGLLGMALRRDKERQRGEGGQLHEGWVDLGSDLYKYG